MSTKQLITRKEAAEICSVTTKTIDVWVKEGKLSRVKFGTSRNSCSRIKMADLQKLINPELQVN